MKSVNLLSLVLLLSFVSSSVFCMVRPASGMTPYEEMQANKKNLGRFYGSYEAFLRKQRAEIDEELRSLPSLSANSSRRSSGYASGAEDIK